MYICYIYIYIYIFRVLEHHPADPPAAALRHKARLIITSASHYYHYYYYYDYDYSYSCYHYCRQER